MLLVVVTEQVMSVWPKVVFAAYGVLQSRRMVVTGRMNSRYDGPRGARRLGDEAMEEEVQAKAVAMRSRRGREAESKRRPK